MKRLFPFLIVLAVISLSACASTSLRSGPSMPLPAATQAPAMPLMEVGGGAAPAPYAQLGTSNDQSKGGYQQSPATSPDRMVVKNADLSIVVKDVNARVSAIQAMTTSMGGFVVSANVYQTTIRDGTSVPQANMVIRVPQEKLDQALSQIKQDTVDVPSESQSGQDVTDQYVDLQSRLKAKEAAEAQLLEIMKNATKTEDVLAVYSQLQQIESDIEVLKGQIKYTEQSASLSAISVTIIAEETVKPIEVGGWKPQGVARDAIQSLIYFWQDFVDFLIRFTLLILPILITIAIPIFLIFLLLRWLIRKLSRPRAEAQPTVAKKK